MLKAAPEQGLQSQPWGQIHPGNPSLGVFISVCSGACDLRWDDFVGAVPAYSYMAVCTDRFCDSSPQSRGAGLKRPPPDKHG